MDKAHLSRRHILGVSAAALFGSMLPKSVRSSGVATGQGADPFRYCLNTSTIRGQNLPLDKEIEVAAQAGYNAIEPWVGKVQDYEKGGGNLRDIKKLLDDNGLTVESAITFPSWIVDDDAQRAKGVEQIKQEMDLLARIGGKRIAAPPAGINRGQIVDLAAAAHRYRAILEIGDASGVTPELEIWGGSTTLHLLGQAMYVVIESGHPKACLLPDVYHIYKGGGSHTGLRHISAGCIQVLHMNDYPADPPRERIGDGDRVMPGGGIAPMTQILRDMLDNHSRAVLSLELFSRTYWERPALDVAKEGLAKMKAEVAKAIAAG